MSNQEAITTKVRELQTITLIRRSGMTFNFEKITSLLQRMQNQGLLKCNKMDAV